MSGFYAVGHIPISDKSSFYGVLGFTSGKITASIPPVYVTGSDSSLSYGFGGDFKIKDNMSANVEYMSYINETSYDVTAINFGISFGF